VPDDPQAVNRALSAIITTERPIICFMTVTPEPLVRTVNQHGLEVLLSVYPIGGSGLTSSRRQTVQVLMSPAI